MISIAPDRGNLKPRRHSRVESLVKAAPFLLVLVVLAPGLRAAYDPLAPAPAEVSMVDLAFTDRVRQREIPLRAYLRKGAPGKHPVILFSHGLGGSRENNRYLGAHWAARDYVVVVLQHAPTRHGREMARYN